MTTQRKPGTFSRGDPRINRNGRPKTFDAVRSLAQQIAHETAKAGNSEIIIDGHRVTVTEAILRQWATSKDARLQQAFMEWAYGKPPQEVKHQGSDGGPVEHVIRVTFGDQHRIAGADADASGDPGQPG